VAEQDQRSRRNRRALAGGLTLAALGGLAAAGFARRRQEPWSTDEDPCGPDGLLMPDGRSFAVSTDDGAVLEAVVAGPAEGATVVLPHCWTGNKEIWAAVARRLVADGRRVVLYDQRGHGKSTLGTGPMTTDRLGDDLLAVLDEVGGRDLVLAGHSMGGMTIQALASNHPEVIRERVRGIALVATACRVWVPPLPAALFNPIMGEMADRQIARRGLGATRGSVGSRPQRAHVQATFDAFQATPGAVRTGFLSGMARMDHRRGIASIDVPVEIVVGTRDMLTPPARARELARLIPNAHLTVLPGRGHMLPLEAPAEVAEKILAL
jgi:pimeloyl-ACP methyl ester carboxylesterase